VTAINRKDESRNFGTMEKGKEEDEGSNEMNSAKSFNRGRERENWGTMQKDACQTNQ